MIKFEMPKFKSAKFKFNELKIDKPKIKIFRSSKGIKEIGNDFELRVKKHLIKKRYSVEKSYNQHYDLHAIKNGKIYYVECKHGKATLSDHEINFRDKILSLGHNYILARTSPTNRITLKIKRGKAKYLK